MAHQLPHRFIERTDELVSLIHDYEATTDSVKQNEALSKALITSCHLLSSIDLASLQRDIEKVFNDVVLYERHVIRTQTWHEAMFDEPEHFSYFLENVEDAILCTAGLNQASRSRILRELQYLREYARASIATILPQQIVNSISRLRDEICELKDQRVTIANRRSRYLKVSKVVMVSVIVIDAVGSLLVPTASPAATAASIALGGVAQYLPD